MTLVSPACAGFFPRIPPRSNSGSSNYPSPYNGWSTANQANLACEISSYTRLMLHSAIPVGGIQYSHTLRWSFVIYLYLPNIQSWRCLASSSFKPQPSLLRSISGRNHVLPAIGLPRKVHLLQWTSRSMPTETAGRGTMSVTCNSVLGAHFGCHHPVCMQQ